LSISFNPAIVPTAKIETSIIQTSLGIAAVTAAVTGTFYALSSGGISLQQAALAGGAIGLSSLYLMREGAIQEETQKPPLASPSFIDARPPKVRKAIDLAFDSISKLPTRIWTYNGDYDSYKMLRLNECSVLQKIIKKAPIEQKDFYIVDLGAGNFAVAKRIAKFIKDNPNLLRPDQKVHIISVRGEENNDTQVLDEGSVIRHNLGKFKIENLSEVFQKLGLPLENNVDLVLSSWTFRHLVDPVGALAQTYNLLKQNGLLLSDGFFALNESNEELSVPDANNNLKQILTKLNAPVFLRHIPDDNTLTQFALKRPNLTPFPSEIMEYSTPLTLKDKDISSAVTTIARFKDQEIDGSLPYLGGANPAEIDGYPAHYGSKELADELIGASNFQTTPQLEFAHYQIYYERSQLPQTEVKETL